MRTAIGNRPTVIFWLVALAALHLVVACAGFFAPYDPTAQDREAPYLPPAHLHWLDSKGSFHFRPFFFALHPDERHFGEYEQDARTTSAASLSYFRPAVPALRRLAKYSRIFLARAVPRFSCLERMHTGATSSRGHSTADRFRFSPDFWRRCLPLSSAFASADSPVSRADGPTRR